MEIDIIDWTLELIRGFLLLIFDDSKYLHNKIFSWKI